MRTTKQKHALFDVLTRGRTWSAKQLYEALGAKCGNMSTLHRNLNVLTEAGVLQVAAYNKNGAYYELAKTDHHDHLKCQSCGIYRCVKCPEPQTPQKHKVASHQIIFEGVCTGCR